MRNRLCTAIATAIFVLVTVGAAPPLAAASRSTPTTLNRNSSTPPAGQPTINSWALAPTGRDPSQPSSRVFLSYLVAPGTTVNDSVTLWNYSNVQLTFRVYATDAFNNHDGGFDLLTGEKTPTDAGAWVKLPQANVTVGARTKIDIPFSLSVPASVRPGDHAGAVLAANAIEGTGADGKVVTLDRRTGSRLYVRVSGPVNAALVVENVHVVYHGGFNPLSGALDVTYTVRNAGNVRLKAHQRVTGSGPLGIGRSRRHGKDIPELLPDNAVTLKQHFAHVPALLRAGAEIRLQPFSSAPDITDIKSTRRAGHTWAIPWSLVFLVAVAWGTRRLLARRGRVVARDAASSQGELTRVS